LNILLIEPFLIGSHQSWAEGLQEFSNHTISILSLPGRHWKWRMAGAAIELVEQFTKLERMPDAILATDMLDLATFLGLIRGSGFEGKVGIYFHENQITYPWSPTDRDKDLKRDFHYGFKNLTSALSADVVYFNSDYHKNAFLEALPGFTGMFPDFQPSHAKDHIFKKSKTLPLGLNLSRLDAFKENSGTGPAIVLWNHRWEYDKNPESFFGVLFKLKEAGTPFQVVVLGESYKQTPEIFEKARQVLKVEIIHFGYAESFETYAKWLWKSDILPVTSYQDFFGISAVEAMWCGVYPLLPNRLAFPGHIPEANRSEFLYDSENDLFKKLNWACKNIDQIRKKQLSRNFVAHYDWSIFSSLYDRQLGEDLMPEKEEID
jgi:glycosyltransferase involved in cell wall biosynthesis